MERLRQQAGAPCDPSTRNLVEQTITDDYKMLLDMHDFIEGETKGAQRMVNEYTKNCPGPTSMNGVDRIGKAVTAVFCHYDLD